MPICIFETIGIMVSPSRSLGRDGQTSPHKPRLVVPHSTCPSLSPSPGGERGRELRERGEEKGKGREGEGERRRKTKKRAGDREGRRGSEREGKRREGGRRSEEKEEKEEKGEKERKREREGERVILSETPGI